MPGPLDDPMWGPFPGYYEPRYEHHPDANSPPKSWSDIVPRNGQMKRILERLRNKKYKTEDKKEKEI